MKKDYLGSMPKKLYFQNAQVKFNPIFHLICVTTVALEISYTNFKMHHINNDATCQICAEK